MIRGRFGLCILPLLFGVMLSFAAVATAGGGSAERPDLSGMWQNQLFTMDDSRWSLEDVICPQCSPAGNEYLTGLLADPANDEKSITELGTMAGKYTTQAYVKQLTEKGLGMVERLDIEGESFDRCAVPITIFEMVWQPLPMQVEQHEDRVVFRYELYNVERTVYMDGRGHPDDWEPTDLGHSIGWYDGDTLVVETRGMNPYIFLNLELDLGGIPVAYLHSDQAVATERYRLSKGGAGLDLELTVVDPVVLKEPLVQVPNWLKFPDLEIMPFNCEVKSGVF